MKSSGKQANIVNALHCAYCAIRFGTAERRVVRQGKPFHNTCYEKARTEEETYEPSPKEYETGISRG